MNIAFWSNVRHQSGVTSSVALLSVLWTQLYVEEVAVTSNHICSGGLVKRLCENNVQEKTTSKRPYEYIFGEPEYFRILYSKESTTTLWINDNLRFIPMVGNERELFGIEGLNGLNKEVEKEECLMIDTACGCGMSSQKILEDAEVTVVMFPPEKERVDDFFQSDTVLKENSFFIFGNYRSGTACRPTYLTKRYHIPRERIGVIPYNFGFEQAMKDGSTVSYIAGNMNCSTRNASYRFIRYAKETVNNLREYALNRGKIICGDCEKV
ncbi:MAG: hypothetical protein IJZ55_10640 [Lachnospiraceae bacterium]|nr:hypothetical protein [Lachnospiraceae bacterium]